MLNIIPCQKPKFIILKLSFIRLKLFLQILLFNWYLGKIKLIKNSLLAQLSKHYTMLGAPIHDCKADVSEYLTNVSIIFDLKWIVINEQFQWFQGCPDYELKLSQEPSAIVSYCWTIHMFIFKWIKKLCMKRFKIF